MPAYNSEIYIKDSIESVLAQTYQNWELIIVDDGSTDSTAIITKAFVSRDIRIKYHYQQNQKQGKARNFGITNSQGDWIAFLDHDDLWMPEKLEKQIEFINSNNVDLVFSDSYAFYSPNISDDHSFEINAGYYKGLDALKLFLERNRIPILTVLARKKAIIDCGGFEEHPDVQNADDYLLWLRMLTKGFSFYGLPSKLAYYRIHKHQTSGNDHSNHEQVLNIFYGSYFEVRPELTNFFRENRIKWYKNWYCCVAQDKTTAYKILFYSVKINSMRLIALATAFSLIICGLKFSKKAFCKLLSFRTNIQLLIRIHLKAL